MTQKQTGYVVLIAALGVMATLLGNEISAFHAWGEALAPAFIGKALIHVGTVVGAFVGGKLIPTVESDANRVNVVNFNGRNAS